MHLLHGFNDSGPPFFSKWASFQEYCTFETRRTGAVSIGRSSIIWRSSRLSVTFGYCPLWCGGWGRTATGLRCRRVPFQPKRKRSFHGSLFCWRGRYSAHPTGRLASHFRELGMFHANSNLSSAYLWSFIKIRQLLAMRTSFFHHHS